MKIATWNVNSIKVRLPQLLEWLKNDRPDIVLLQELKCTDDTFPAMEIEGLGYHIATHGQKTYNGVAILSKYKLDDIHKGLAGDDNDLQARYIEAVASLPANPAGIGAIRVASVYVPNGQDVTSDKFPYKLQFLERLHDHLKNLLTYGEMLVVGGDYNIAPADIDVHHPKQWEGSVLTHDDVRRALRRTSNLGFSDAFRQSQPNMQAFSWWDYRGNGFEHDEGLRIDHLLLSPLAADLLKNCHIERQMRAAVKASDHAPIVAEFTL